MQKIVLSAVGLVLLVAIGGGIVFVSISSNSEERTDSSHKSTSSDHDGITNFSESKVQNLTKLDNVNISISGADFRPNNIQIKKGTKVTWINNDNTTHSLMSENSNAHSRNSVPMDNTKENALTSPKLNKGMVYDFTFSAIGQTYYHCSTHPNIRGKVTVVE